MKPNNAALSSKHFKSGGPQQKAHNNKIIRSFIVLLPFILSNKNVPSSQMQKLWKGDMGRLWHAHKQRAWKRCNGK